MKKALMAVVLVLCMAASVQAADPYGGKFNSFTFSLGGYWPGGDMDDEGYKSGADFDVIYMRVLQDWFGFGCGTHFYGSQSKKTTADIGDGSASAFGIEMLLMVQPNQWQVQPYIGIGPAIYYNYLAYDDDVDDDGVDDSGVGLGGILKAGVRIYITERFFSGLSVKVFSNNWNLDVEENRDKTYDFGGGVLAFDLGFTF